MRDIKTLIPCIYYPVPPCPSCGSICTGYYKKMVDDSGWLSKEGLKHGEIIKEVSEITDNNVFCEDCGFEWEQEILPSIISRAKRNSMMKEKGLVDRLDEMRARDKEEYNDYKKEHPILARFKKRQF